MPRHRLPLSTSRLPVGLRELGRSAKHCAGSLSNWPGAPPIRATFRRSDGIRETSLTRPRYVLRARRIAPLIDERGELSSARRQRTLSACPPRAEQSFDPSVTFLSARARSRFSTAMAAELAPHAHVFGHPIEHAEFVVEAVLFDMDGVRRWPARSHR